MKTTWLKLAALLALTMAFNASAMTTADNASKAPASKAVTDASEGKRMPTAGGTVRSAQGAASEAQRPKPKK